MKYILLSLIALTQVAFVSARATYNIKDFGAKGNGKSSNTVAINNAIKACNENGGGIVLVPAGKYLSGTIELLDNVELRLAEGAELIASLDLNDYKPYKCLRDDFMKYKVAYTEYWNRSFILAQRVKNIAITGDGVINSNHLVDPNGEGRSRGPHCIMLGEVDGVTIRGVHITEASNYGVMGYEVVNATFDNIKVTKGHDAIHLRGAKNLMIRDCSFETGDDCIAGGFWENAVIKNCYIHSTCNGIRIIFPVKDLEISHC
jgi:polygalacturonase